MEMDVYPRPLIEENLDLYLISLYQNQGIFKFVNNCFLATSV